MKWIQAVLLVLIIAILAAFAPIEQARQQFAWIVAKRLTVTNAVDFNGDLDVDGTANLDVVDIDGAADFASTVTFNGSPSLAAALDLDGNELTLDSDADTSITADTDDQIDIEVSGADDFVITANLFESQTGSVIDLNGTKLEVDADADTSITADTDDQIDFEIGGADEITLTAAALSLNNTYIDQDLGTENIGALPTVCSTSITYTAAAGGTGTVCSIGANEIWLIHKVFVNSTTNFDCTGDDCVLEVGDGNDANGFIAAADANLQTTFTEATGYQAGWFGLENGSNGAYTVDDGAFIYAPSSAETIDWTLSAAGNDFSAGAATIYVVYTRLQ